MAAKPEQAKNEAKQVARTFAELHAQIKRMSAEGKSKYEIIRELYATKVNVTFEKLRPVNGAPADTVIKQSDGETDQLVSVIDDSRIARVLLSVNKNMRLKQELHFACNGIVLDSNTWDVICMPSPALADYHSYKSKSIHQALRDGKYTVTKIRDGTCINLYYYGDRWQMGTGGAYDMSGYRWIGPTTYREHFVALMEKYPEFKFDRLDRATTYTIGMRCDDFHQLAGDPPGLWFVQATRCDPVTRVYTPVENTFGLPGLTVVNPPQYKLEYLLNQLKHALLGYKRTHALYYGVVLRGNFGELREISNIKMESTLLTAVKYLMYDLPKNITSIDHNNRSQYMAVRSFLDYKNKDTFLVMFPRYQRLYKEYCALLDRVVERIMIFYRNRADRISPDITDPVSGLALVFVNDLANRKSEKINPYSDTAKPVIRDFITHPGYIDLYFTYFLKYRECQSIKE
jgi:hypothetical protein